MESKSLFTIEQEYLRLMADIEAAEGVLTEELEERLRISDNDFEKKVRAYAFVIKSLKTDETMLKDEAKRLTDRAKSTVTRADQLKRAIENAFNIKGVDSFKAVDITVFRKSNAETVYFSDDNCTLGEETEEGVEKTINNRLLDYAKNGKFSSPFNLPVLHTGIPSNTNGALSHLAVSAEELEIKRVFGSEQPDGDAGKVEENPAEILKKIEEDFVNAYASATTFTLNANVSAKRLNEIINILENNGVNVQKEISIEGLTIKKATIKDCLDAGIPIPYAKKHRSQSIIIR